MTYLTFHVLRALPMHNLNRDQNGMPKSQFDGGIQRGRLSSQSLKRPARIAFRAAVQHLNLPTSVRTTDSNAAVHVVKLARQFAQDQGKTLDRATALKTANSVVKGLAKRAAKVEEPVAVEKTASDGATDTPKEVEKKDNILFFSEAELETLAWAIVGEQNGAAQATTDDFIQDVRSASLDVAAFGRMFAFRGDLSTYAAVAVSHAVMTHEMNLTIDYFTTIDEMDDEPTSSSAGHLGLSYFTSGVYYSTFTVDTTQLRRSWSGIGSGTAKIQIQALIEALLKALPPGKLTNTNAHTRPFLVLVENQRSRSVYEFETPVTKGVDGGYTQPSIDSLAAQYALARNYDAANYLDTMLFAPGVVTDFPGSTSVDSLDDLTARAAEQIIQASAGQVTS